jgi:hypothetical protein
VRYSVRRSKAKKKTYFEERTHYRSPEVLGKKHLLEKGLNVIADMIHLIMVKT